MKHLHTHTKVAVHFRTSLIRRLFETNNSTIVSKRQTPRETHSCVVGRWLRRY